MSDETSNPVELKYDPTMPVDTISINGKVYRMCFDFSALAEAEGELKSKGIPCNILGAIRLDSISAVQTLFAASLRRYQPELAWEDALDLVTWQTFGAIAPAVGNALAQAMSPADPEAKPEDKDDSEDQNPQGAD